MATIKVDSTAMQEKANSFKGISKNIHTYTDDLDQEITGMKKVWEGEAAEGAVNKFKEFKQAFEEKKQTIDNYALFLEKAAEAYNNSENAVKNATAK